MTDEEIDKWQQDFPHNIFPKDTEKYENDDVSFKIFCSSINYRCKKNNAFGLIFADLFFEGSNNYRPRVSISPSYSNDCRFSLSADPTFNSITEAILKSWKLFIK